MLNLTSQVDFFQVHTEVEARGCQREQPYKEKWELLCLSVDGKMEGGDLGEAWEMTLGRWAGSRSGRASCTPFLTVIFFSKVGGHNLDMFSRGMAWLDVDFGDVIPDYRNLGLDAENGEDTDSGSNKKC